MAGHDSDSDAKEASRLARLRAQAEQEMRRRLPDEDRRATKRRKGSRDGDGGGGGGSGGGGTGGRFDYAADKALAAGISGFILTSALHRENSARKEAGPLLARYLEQCAPAATPDSGGGSDNCSGAAERVAGPDLAAVKVSCCGVVALMLPAHRGGGTDDGDAALVGRVAAAVLADVDGGSQSRLQHVQRIVPVQTSCKLERQALHAAGARLAAHVAAALLPVASCSAAAAAGREPQGAATAGQGGEQAAAGEAASEGAPAARRVSFGVALKHRQLPDAGGAKQGDARAPASAEPGHAAEPGGAAATAADTAAATAGSDRLDRGAIIAALAGGFDAAMSQRHGVRAAVDLRAPDVVLLAEVLPVGGALYAALCALPRALCSLKPKLHIRPVGQVR